MGKNIGCVGDNCNLTATLSGGRFPVLTGKDASIYLQQELILLNSNPTVSQALNVVRLLQVENFHEEADMVLKDLERQINSTDYATLGELHRLRTISLEARGLDSKARIAESIANSLKDIARLRDDLGD